jgi:hypothetical protein
VSDGLESQSHYGTSLPDSIVHDDVVDDAPRKEREGLPRSYRMRADPHYVEQLNAPMAAQPVRMVAITEIDADVSDQKGLRPLVESIRKLGIVHPLLVRRRSGRYSLIAGRKRLSAAHTLRLSSVPCLVHDVDDAQSLALAAADGLVAGVPGGQPERIELISSIREIVARHLAKVRECVDLAAAGEPWATRSVPDLIRAHTWRAARLTDALDLILNRTFPSSFDRPVRKIVEGVADGFAAEARLSAITIAPSSSGDSRLTGLSDRELEAGLSAAVLAMLPFVERVQGAVLSVHVASPGAESMSIEIAQSAVSVSPLLARHFFDDDMVALVPGDSPVAIGALATKAFAQRTGGQAAMEIPPEGGSRIRIDLPAPRFP